MYVDEAKQTEEDREVWLRYRSRDLICEHSYAVLRCVESAGGERLVLLRNPWGTTKHVLWTGRYEMGGEMWTVDLREEVGYGDSDGRDGYFWMCWEDCVEWFTTLSTGYAMRGWGSLRTQGRWEAGCSGLLLRVHVRRTTRAIVAVHQRDTRGIQPGSSEDDSYAQVDLWVVMVRKGKDPQVIESTSSSRRDVCREVSLTGPKRQGGVSELYILAQPKKPASKGFVYSLLVEDPAVVDVCFCRPASGAVQPENAKEIRAADWRPCAASWQATGWPGVGACDAEDEDEFGSGFVEGEGGTFPPGCGVGGAEPGAAAANGTAPHSSSRVSHHGGMMAGRPTRAPAGDEMGLMVALLLDAEPDGADAAPVLSALFRCFPIPPPQYDGMRHL